MSSASRSTTSSRTAAFEKKDKDTTPPKTTTPSKSTEQEFNNSEEFSSGRRLSQAYMELQTSGGSATLRKGGSKTANDSSGDGSSRRISQTAQGLTFGRKASLLQKYGGNKLQDAELTISTDANDKTLTASLKTRKGAANKEDSDEVVEDTITPVTTPTTASENKQQDGDDDDDVSAKKSDDGGDDEKVSKHDDDDDDDEDEEKNDVVTTANRGGELKVSIDNDNTASISAGVNLPAASSSSFLRSAGSPSPTLSAGGRASVTGRYGVGGGGSGGYKSYTDDYSSSSLKNNDAEKDNNKDNLAAQIRRYFIDADATSANISGRSKRMIRESLEDASTLRDIRIAYERRIEEIESEIERETQARLRLEKQCDLMQKEGEELAVKLEDSDAIVSTQSEKPATAATAAAVEKRAVADKLSAESGVTAAGSSTSSFPPVFTTTFSGDTVVVGDLTEPSYLTKLGFTARYDDTAETNRKREFELAKIRKELDEQQAMYETQVQQLKKKQQEHVSELTDQLDQNQRLKIKLDRENKEFQRLLEEMTINYEKAEKRRQVVEKQAKQIESQAADLASQLQDITHSFTEIKVVRAKLAQENSDLVKKVHELESQNSQMSKSNKALQAQLEDVSNTGDEAARMRSKVQSDLRVAMADLEQMRGQVDETEISKLELEKTIKRLNGELLDLKTKLAGNDNAKSEELEDAKRKLQSRLYEAEQQIENMSSKLVSSERAKSKLQAEIDEVTADNERLTQTAQQLDKRQKQSDRNVLELQGRIQQLQMELDQAVGELKHSQTEVIRLRTELEDSKLVAESLRKENKNLNDEVRELVEQHRQAEWQSNEREKARKALEQDKEELVARIDEMDGLYRSERGKIDRIQSDFNQLREDFERRLSEREEEFESAKKNMQFALETSQSNAENEARAKLDALRARKKMEEVVNELEGRLQQALMAASEAEKLAKRAQQQTAEQQASMANALNERDHLRQQLVNTEKRIAGFASEISELNVTITQLSKSKKQHEAETTEAMEQMQQLQTQNNALAAQKRRLESEFQALRDEYETVTHDMQIVDEKLRRMQADWSSSADELNHHRLAVENSEQARKKLELQLKEAIVRIQELESMGLNKLDKRATAGLEQRCRELETALTEETKRHADTQRLAKRNDLKVRDLMSQMEEDKRAQDRLKEVVERVQQKMKLYKKQLEEAEENGVIQMNKFRKLQQELQEAEQRAESSESMLAKIRIRGRTPVLQTGGLRAQSPPSSYNNDHLVTMSSSAPAPPSRQTSFSGAINAAPLSVNISGFGDTDAPFQGTASTNSIVLNSELGSSNGTEYDEANNALTATTI